MEIDVHNMKRVEAKEYIFLKLKECYKRKDHVLRVIHGYNNGTAIKDWIRNTKQMPDIVKEVMDDFTNSGITNIYLKIKLY